MSVMLQKREVLVHFSQIYALLLQQSFSKCRFKAAAVFHFYPVLTATASGFIYRRFLIYVHNWHISYKRRGRVNIITDVEEAAAATTI
jgi:hypothetical protein